MVGKKDEKDGKEDEDAQNGSHIVSVHWSLSPSTILSVYTVPGTCRVFCLSIKHFRQQPKLTVHSALRSGDEEGTETLGSGGPGAQFCPCFLGTCSETLGQLLNLTEPYSSLNCKKKR